MIDLDDLPTHPLIEQIVDNLIVKTDSSNREYFRVLTAYFFAKVASCMRAEISSPDSDQHIPVNCFATMIAPSGFGKGKSIGILSDLVEGFRHRFNEDTFPVISEQQIWSMAISRAAITGKTEDEEKAIFDRLFREAGPYVFTAKGATASSIQQMRGKLLLSTAGAVNIQIDEIGSNLSSMAVVEALNVFLELYDMGKTEISMTKNTSENGRMPDIPGNTPANLLVFGEPIKLFDGSTNESTFMSLLGTGYARRCLFAWGERSQDELPTPEELLARRMAARNASSNAALKNHFALLADPARHKWLLTVPDDVALMKTGYEIMCKQRAKDIPSTDEIRRPEMENRHFKALKIAGALAYVDESIEITSQHLKAAIGIVEDSGKAFEKMLSRDEPHVRLAKYIAQVGTEVTHHDIKKNFPFCNTPTNLANNMTYARAWGYKNHVIIRNRFEDNVELFSGESLQETNPDEMLLSWSGDFAYNYEPVRAPWHMLHELTQLDASYQFCNHHFENQHRSDDNTIPGFNMVIYDFDGGVPLETVHDLMKGIRFMTYTTKRHTPEDNRFRLILPINYELKLNKEDYRAFVESLSEVLPFAANLSDDASKKRSQKWLCCDTGTYHYGEGELIDCLSFIPRTTKHEDHQKKMQSLGSLDNLERWFAQRMEPGNRNNQMIKFALTLVDTGMAFIDVEQAVVNFNSKLSHALTEDELRSTILVTVAKKIAAAEAAA